MKIFRGCFTDVETLEIWFESVTGHTGVGILLLHGERYSLAAVMVIHFPHLFKKEQFSFLGGWVVLLLVLKNIETVFPALLPRISIKTSICE